MLVDANEHGRAYNCMGQSTMGLGLLRAGKKWGVDDWVDDGVAALNVMLTEYGAGGLLLRDAESDTAWYCGKTSRSAETKGATLNKHLYATRTFLEAAEVMRDLGRTELAARYEEAGEEGFLKLIKGAHAPKLKDYFVRDDGGDFYFKSWTYYSLGNADKDRPYFLKAAEKNAHYHLYEMQLIFRIYDMIKSGSDTDGSFNFRPFSKTQIDSLSAFGAYFEIYENKLEMGGLGKDTSTLFGQFGPTPDGDDDQLSNQVTEWFEEVSLCSTTSGNQQRRYTARLRTWREHKGRNGERHSGRRWRARYTPGRSGARCPRWI